MEVAEEFRVFIGEQPCKTAATRTAVPKRLKNNVDVMAAGRRWRRWAGRKLTWDPEKETFVGDDEANQFLARPQRAGFEIPDESV
jgi:hypothetical protein